MAVVRELTYEQGAGEIQPATPDGTGFCKINQNIAGYPRNSFNGQTGSDGVEFSDFFYAATTMIWLADCAQVLLGTNTNLVPSNHPMVGNYMEINIDGTVNYGGEVLA